MQKFRTTLTIFIIIAFHTNSFSNSTKKLNFEKTQKQFIKQLFLNKEYFNSIAETRRLLNYTNIKYQHDFLYFINVNYFLGNQYKTVIFHTNENYNLINNHFASKLLYATSLQKLGHPIKAYEFLNSIAGTKLTKLEQEELFFRKIEIELQLQNFKNAYILSKEFSQNNISNKNILNLSIMLSKYTEIKKRSTAIATTLSAIFPGAGQLYCNRYSAALISFATVAAASASAYYFYKKENNSLAYTTGFFAVLFYTGNIYGAYNSAKSYNYSANSNFINNISNKYIETYNPVKYINKENIFK